MSPAANRSPGRSSADSASLAPGSGSIVRSPPGATSTMHVPVGSSGSTLTCRSTPSSALSATGGRVVVADAPDQRHLDARACASHAATFAPAPAGPQRDRARRVAARARAARRGPRRRRHEIAEDEDHSAQRAAISAASAALRRTRRTFARRHSPLGPRVEALEQERGHVAAGDALPRPRPAGLRAARGRAARGRSARRAGSRPRPRPARRARAARAAPRRPPPASPPAT